MNGGLNQRIEEEVFKKKKKSRHAKDVECVLPDFLFCFVFFLRYVRTCCLKCWLYAEIRKSLVGLSQS